MILNLLAHWYSNSITPYLKHHMHPNTSNYRFDISVKRGKKAIQEVFLSWVALDRDR